MANMIHLVKLSVGSDSVEQMEDWQQNRSKQRINGQYFHLTRMWPKREAELLNGGSIYWVVKGFLQARQRILSLEEVIGDDGIRRCAIVLDPELVRTTVAPKRPFQGWRYLKPEDAPLDLGKSRQNDDALPPELAGALADIGVL
jgi:hypothetical protein